jgi:hypothetical protein
LAEVAGEDGRIGLTVRNTLTQDVVLHTPSALIKYSVEIVGLRMVVAPVTIYVPPQDDVYQNQLAPVPKLPPDTERVEDEPPLIAEGEADADVDEVELLSKSIKVLKHDVVLHCPSALT